ncbi:MAG: tetratricopeptide repeat protein, partial [Brevinema sp.]
KALHLFLCSAEQGNAYADYEAAKMFQDGSGTQRDKDKSEYHFKIAFQGFLKFESERSDDKLLHRIGQMYLTGTGTEQNEEKAIVYLEKAVELENDNAKCLLAKIYIRQEEEKAEKKEEGQYEKIKKAIEWLEKAYENKDMAAAYHLGMIWKKGIFFPADLEKAIAYLEEASKGKNQYADYQLGKIFEERNEMIKAFFYYGLSAEQGNELAAYRLGKIYFLGEKTEKNVLLAIEYLEQAAQKGNQYASFALGKLFLCGKDIPRDMEKAKFWLTKSAMQGNPYAVFLLEHMNEQYEPNLLLTAAKLVHHMGNLFEGKGNQGFDSTMQITERKLRSKIRNKKIAQGHAADDHVP